MSEQQSGRQPRGRAAERAVWGEILATLRHVAQSQTVFAARLAGQLVNDTLEVRHHVFGSGGQLALTWHVPAGAVVVDNLGAGDVTVSSAGPGASAPTGGTGVYVVPGGTQRVVALASRQCTLYGAAGEAVNVQAFTAGVLAVAAPAGAVAVAP